MARIIPVFIPHEGCPHDCVFCNQRRIAAPVSPSPEDVREQVCTAVHTAGAGAQVAFYGGSFTAIPRARQEAYLKAIADLPVTVRLSTRPDAIDSEVLTLLSYFPVETIELGAQSMSDRVLACSGRGHTAEDTRRASAQIQKAGFSLILQAMCGLPEDGGTWVDTAREIAALEPDGVRIYPVVVIRDTKLYDLWKAGQYTPLTPEEGAHAAADMLEVFLRRRIPVIRIGLNPTQELSAGGAAAGAYHPALGEMARAQIYLRRMLACAGALREGILTFYVNPNRISRALGIRKGNLEALRQLGYENVKVCGREGLDEYEVESFWS